jgi:hypothetical protein
MVQQTVLGFVLHYVIDLSLVIVLYSFGLCYFKYHRYNTIICDISYINCMLICRMNK